ncbi:MAG: CBS domain-containing protein [Lachnospiraceae bacterium]
MNILFFLTPKSDVATIYVEDTLRQALEKLETHGYTAIPIISKTGKYIGTITEGDLLWYIKDHANLNLFDAEDVPLTKVSRRRDNAPVSINANMEDLWDKVMNQNFVPVIDDDNIFIGIVTRKDAMMYLRKENRRRA